MWCSRDCFVVGVKSVLGASSNGFSNDGHILTKKHLTYLSIKLQTISKQIKSRKWLKSKVKLKINFYSRESASLFDLDGDSKGNFLIVLVI